MWLMLQGLPSLFIPDVASGFQSQTTLKTVKSSNNGGERHELSRRLSAALGEVWKSVLSAIGSASTLLAHY
jgi:hypothetical protein